VPRAEPRERIVGEPNLGSARPEFTESSLDRTACYFDPDDGVMDLEAPTAFSKYELVTRLAVGGMAELYLARTRGIPGFEKYLVIKRILRERTKDPEFVRMFLDEARVAATLDHTNVVHIYDVGCVDGEYFIAMEYISGRNVFELVQAAQRRKPGGLPIETVITIAAGAAAGLHYAHEKRDFGGTPLSIVHRDVTPQNVMVTFDGAVKLVDFGIVKAANREAETLSGTLKGKLGYMSPEQCTGKPLDGRSDLFALGVLMYELSLGKRLYREKTEFETLRKIVDGPVPSIREVDATLPAELDAIVQRCLQKRADDRYPTARDLLVALEDLARERRYNIGVAALAKYLEELFPEEVNAHREGGGVAALAIARASGSAPSYFGESKEQKTKASVPMSRAREKFFRRRRLRALGLGVVAVVAAAGVWYLRTRPLAATPTATPVAAHPAEPPPMDSSQLTGPGDLPPKLLQGKPAKLPSATLPLSPTIICRLLIGSDGTVERAQVFRSRLELQVYEDAALAAAQDYRFRPAQHAGAPVAVWINWPVRFAASPSER
jgi:serine/threonine protein kinase